MNLYEVTRFEVSLYNVWKDPYENMRTVEKCMKEYFEEFHRILSRVGEMLYRLFSEVYDDFEKGEPIRNSSEYIEEWNKILVLGYKQLNLLWKKNNLRLLRKGIKLL